MNRLAIRIAGFLAVLAMAMGLLGFVSSPAVSANGCAPPTITSSHRPIPNSSAANTIDGSAFSFFNSSFDNWQFLQLDYGCVGSLNGMRRLMSLGFGSTANRGAQGERLSYSIDGITWTDVLVTDTTGWENYVDYRPNAWHTVDYGYSDQLVLNTPAQARFVRFHWDGARDFLHELEIDFARPPTTPQLAVRLQCDSGVVACEARATGGRGLGYTFAWKATNNASIGSQTDNGAVSSVSGTCRAGSTYEVEVTVGDGLGRTKSARVRQPCVRIPH